LLHWEWVPSIEKAKRNKNNYYLENYIKCEGKPYEDNNCLNYYKNDDYLIIMQDINYKMINVLNNDVLCHAVRYLEIYDAYAFIKTCKKFWNTRWSSRLFKDYYYNADMALVGLAWNCWNENQTVLFFNLCQKQRLYTIVLAEEFFNSHNTKFYNYMTFNCEMSVTICKHRSNRERFLLVNLPPEKLKNINWIWQFNSFTKFFGLDLKNMGPGIITCPYVCGPSGYPGINLSRCEPPSGFSDLGSTDEAREYIIKHINDTIYGNDDKSCTWYTKLLSLFSFLRCRN
jgi:hypothetical protein